MDGIRVDPLPLGHSLRVGADDRVLAACDEIEEMFFLVRGLEIFREWLNGFEGCYCHLYLHGYN